MMQHGKGSGNFPPHYPTIHWFASNFVRSVSINLEEKPSGIQRGLPEQRQAEVHAEIRALMSLLRQFARQFRRSRIPGLEWIHPLQHVEHAPYSRLDAVPRRRKGAAETGIKILINLN
jgi:hypothetical protein